MKSGVYPASVTPFDAKGHIDFASMARLLAHFEHSGCTGVVLAGTNGEGPSLSAPEKRDLIREMSAVRGSLDLVLGIATPSLDEAVWLTKRAADHEAVACLVMPPSYFRAAPIEGVRDWYSALLDKSPSPILIYNFPKMTGYTLDASFLALFKDHPNFIGAKDSSGEAANILAYRDALGPDPVLFIGNETLLDQALAAGWSGTISGASNVLAPWICAYVREWQTDREAAAAKFALIQPVIEAIRSQGQPVMNKAFLHRMGIIDRPDPRLPLLPAVDYQVTQLWDQIESVIGPLTK